MAALTGYFGGKNSMSSWIYGNIPKDITSYIEVFGGSMAIYFNEDFSHCNNIIYNDYNKLQSNFMHCCLSYDKVLNQLELEQKKGGFLYCPYSDFKDIKNHYRDLYKKTKTPETSDFYDNLEFEIPDFKRAAIYAFMITSAFNACHARGAGFSGFTKSEKLKLTTLVNKLKKKEFRDKLDNISKVECMDFYDLITKYDSKESYFYLDPPYKYTDGNGTHDKDYGSKDIFGDSSHKRLADILIKTEGRWSLSYYYFKELEDWFPKNIFFWSDKEFNRPSASFSNSEKGKEILIMNYDPKTGIKSS